MKIALLISTFALSAFSTAPQEGKEQPSSDSAQESVAPAFDIMTVQQKNGSWSAQDVPEGLAGVHPGKATDDLWVTSSILLALLGEGTTSATGPHQVPVRKALHWIGGLQKEDGRIVSPGAETDLKVHALATLVLTEHRMFLGETGKGSAAAKAVSYLESRALESGGWNREGSAAGKPDPGTTAWASMAIRSAGDSGIATEMGRLKDAANSMINLNQEATRPTVLGQASELLARLMAGESAQSEGFLSAHRRLLTHAPITIASGYHHDPELFYLRSLVAYQTGGDGWKEWLKEINDMTDRLGLKGNSHQKFLVCDPKLTHGGSLAACGFSILTMQCYFRYARVIQTR
jgi:hypothetical protein